MAKERLGNYISEYSEKNRNNELFPVYSVTNSNGFCMEYFNKDVSSQDKRSYKIVPKGFFAYNPSRINVGSIDCQFCRDIVIVSPLYTVFKVSEELNQDYLKYFFKSDYGKHLVNSNVFGSVRSNLKFDVLSNFLINVDSIEKQLEIVDQLKKIESLIKCEEKQLELYDELIKSRFIEMFGDPKTQEKETGTVEISTVCMLKAGKFVKAADIKDTCKDGMYPCYGANGFRGYVKTFNHDGIYNLIGRQGALCGNVTLVSGKFHATEHAVVVTPLQKLNPYWLYYFLMLLDINRYATGAAQPGLAVSTIEKILVKIPDLGLQEAFGNFFKTIDKSKFVVQKRIKLLNELLNKKMDEYFK